MPQYTVIYYYDARQEFVVDADNEEQAKEKVLSGDIVCCEPIEAIGHARNVKVLSK